MDISEATPGEVIGANVRALRVAGMFTRHELAERAGLSEQGVVRIEQGRSARPRRATIEKLARVLGVPVEKLLEGTAGVPKGSARLSGGEMLRVRPEDIATEQATADINRLFEQKRKGEIEEEDYQRLLGDALRAYHERRARGEVQTETA